MSRSPRQPRVADDIQFDNTYSNHRLLQARATAEMPFLQLPYELRCMIYELCLVVDYDIVPYPSLYDFHGETEFEEEPMPEWPHLNLLGVSKQIRNETVPILYGKNRWRMPTYWGSLYPNAFDIAENVFVLNKKHFRNLIVCFEFREIAHTEDVHLEYVKHIQRHISTSYTDTLKNTAAQLRELIPCLKSLVINLEELICEDGCCRERVLTRFEKAFVSEIACQLYSYPAKIKTEIRGLKKNSKEQKLVYDDWGFDAGGHVNKMALKQRWQRLGSDSWSFRGKVGGEDTRIE